MKNVKVTIYKDLFCNESYEITLEKALSRIQNGNSYSLIQKIRSEQDKEKKDALKKKLPSICFSGTFENGQRKDNLIKEHSGLITLDFDKLGLTELINRKNELANMPYVVACFLSPSGDGLKALVRIKDKTKHREHYNAILKDYPQLDRTNINPARVCFESNDPDIYINYNATEYGKIYIEKVEQKEVTQRIDLPSFEKFDKLRKWMESNFDNFVSGNRNHFIFKLASASCRFGIPQNECEQFLISNYLNGDSDFREAELKQAVNSAYKSNTFASADFDNERLVDKVSREVVEIDLNDNLVKDVIYGRDVFDDAYNIFINGYQSAESTGVDWIDVNFKWKAGEVTCLTGIGNYGKSTFMNWLMIQKSKLDGSKWAVFSPENYPADEWFFMMCELFLEDNMTPANGFRKSEAEFIHAYSFISEHFFYIYPKEIAPTPTYIKSRFLELIIKEKVRGVIIDPFNQMANDYGLSGGRDDKYLEIFLADCSRFALENQVFFVIVAHPHKLQKNKEGGYDAPGGYDIAGGAMWVNKLDNLLTYHRPKHHVDPKSDCCELHTKKIRRQNIVGKLGVIDMTFSFISKRFEPGYKEDKEEIELFVTENAPF